MKTWTTKNGAIVTKILSGRSNVFLISGKNKRILVDTGPGRVWRTLDRRLTVLNIKTLDYLVLTHVHFDHAGNAARIKNNYGASVIVNEYEADFLRKGRNSPTGESNPFTGLLAKLLMPAFSSVTFFHAVEPDILTGLSSSLDIAEANSSVIQTPGHTKGSQSVIVDNEIAVVGDTMFGVFPGSVFPPFALDVKEMVKSWGKLLDTKCSWFLPSHGSEDSFELVKNNYIIRAG
jgi:hydroxyacylglutathione hydrolase